MIVVVEVNVGNVVVELMRKIDSSVAVMLPVLVTTDVDRAMTGLVEVVVATSVVVVVVVGIPTEGEEEE